jgi:hypothetical protein
MAEGTRAPQLRAVPGATMGQTSASVSNSQPAGARFEDPHESVTVAPPAPDFEALLGLRTPMPSVPDDGDEHVRPAIDAGARAGTTLSELSKMVVELSSGVVGARHANEQLLQELTTLRALLSAAREQQAASERRVAELEQEVLDARDQAERERQLVTAQHDDFITALIEEHEAELDLQAGERATSTMDASAGDLARQLVQAEGARLDAEAERERLEAELARVAAQRDEARALAEKRERERNELRAEASLLRAQLSMHRSASTAPPPPLNGPRSPSYRPPSALRLDTSELDSTLLARSSPPRIPVTPRLPNVPRLPPPPPELERVVANAERSESASAFPRVSTRPGVGAPKPTEPAPAPSFGPAPTGWTPPPPAPTGWTPPPPAPTETSDEQRASSTPPAAALPVNEATTVPPRPRVISAASLPLGLPNQAPALKQKPHPTTRPLISYSLGEDGVRTETLEGARISSKPPKK